MSFAAVIVSGVSGAWWRGDRINRDWKSRRSGRGVEVEKEEDGWWIVGKGAEEQVVRESE